MSKVVTPPDIIAEDLTYLIVNATVDDLKMLSYWLHSEEKDYTIHLYHDGMEDHEWLNSVAKLSKHILVNKTISTANTISPIFDYVSKIVWFGENETHARAINYFLDNARTNQ